MAAYRKVLKMKASSGPNHITSILATDGQGELHGGGGERRRRERPQRDSR